MLLEAENNVIENNNVLADNHLYMQALYIEFNQRVTQLVCDTLIGVALLYAASRYPDFFTALVNSLAKSLHLEQLEAKIDWLLGHPAGFKPNKNLAYMLGHFVFQMI